MKYTLAALMFASAITFSYAQVKCNIPAMLSQFREGKISHKQYTQMYTDCITGKLATNFPSDFGFQPSCSSDAAITQAIAKFDNAGEFKAADGSMYPFHVKGVVTFTELDSQTTRIHVTISGVHSFLFDSNLFSLHVHQKGEINPSCSATGGHYNPCGKNHSNDPKAEDRHIADVARVTIPATFASEQDVLTFTQIDTQVKLSGVFSVLGRSVTVHGGAASARVGCGTIAITEWEGVDHPDSTFSLSNPFWN